MDIEKYPFFIINLLNNRFVYVICGGYNMNFIKRLLNLFYEGSNSSVISYIEM